MDIDDWKPREGDQTGLISLKYFIGGMSVSSVLYSMQTYYTEDGEEITTRFTDREFILPLVVAGFFGLLYARMPKTGPDKNNWPTVTAIAGMLVGWWFNKFLLGRH